MRVELTRRAETDIEAIKRYLAERNPRASIEVPSRIAQVVDLLADFPSLGVAWKGTTTRAVIVTGLPYRVHYVVDEAEERVRVITIAHVRRKNPL